MSHNFPPIWISTIDHMDKQAGYARSASFFQKLIGRFDCPKEFPHLKLLWGIQFYSRIPLVYCNYGELKVGDGALDFASKTPKHFGSSVRGHFPKLNFQLDPAQIKSVVEYRYHDPYLSWANLDWVRVRTTEDILGGDFLMCVGGTWPNTIKKQTAHLLSVVQAMSSGKA